MWLLLKSGGCTIDNTCLHFVFTTSYFAKSLLSLIFNGLCWPLEHVCSLFFLLRCFFPGVYVDPSVCLRTNLVCHVGSLELEESFSFMGEGLFGMIA